MLAAALQPHTLGLYLYTVALLAAVAYALEPLAYPHEEAEEEEEAGEEEEAADAADASGASGNASDGSAAAETAPLLDATAANGAAARRTPSTGVLALCWRLLRVAWRGAVGVVSLVSLGVVLLPFESIAQADVRARTQWPPHAPHARRPLVHASRRLGALSRHIRTRIRQRRHSHHRASTRRPCRDRTCEAHAHVGRRVHACE
jgi:hypothetical protein